MKKAFILAAMGLAAITLTGCASDYIMTTKTGQIIEAHGKPEIDKDTGMTQYTDMNGEDHQINTNEVAQMIKRDL
ncbi:YgdI/YgdR family lipoprotein [Salmonella enterica]